jgi:hypothetical protein
VSLLLIKIQELLARSSTGRVNISEEIIEQFGEDCKTAFRKQFTEQRSKDFSIRMSSIGKPLCQLKMEKNKTSSESPPYNFKMRFLFGDLIEAAAIGIIKAAGIKIQSEQKKVHNEIAGTKIQGTYDVEINDKIYDIKSASPWSFDNKLSKGFNSVEEDDTFGYVVQGSLYSDSAKKPFGGWIVINKSTGEWQVVETPEQDEEYKKKALKTAETNIKALVNDEPFERCFEAKPETFNKVLTGNKVLNTICGFCSFKKACWGSELKYLPQQQSKAKSPRWQWYTEVINPKENKDER